MTLIKHSIQRPIAVLAAVLMVVLLGGVALERIPIQLTPEVENPILSVRTIWPGGSVQEVEREIVDKQEDALRGVEGLVAMRGRAQEGRATIRLEFEIGTDMNRAMLIVANRLDQVQDYPDEADEPTIRTSTTEDNPIAWFRLTRLEGNDRPVATFGDFVEDTVQDQLERVPGVSGVNVFGGTAREMQVVIDPQRMARFGLTVTEVLDKLRAANASISAGAVEEGKRRYVVRTEGELTTLDRVRAVALRTVSDPATGRLSRITVDDIAEVKFGYAEPTARIRNLGEEAFGINAVKESGANVIEVMRGIRATVTELNEGPLRQEGLRLLQVYDETDYIDSAITLVQSNIFIGGALAAMVLLIFLRSARATLIISIAIPVSVIGSFVAMAMLGRSINVISLAGLAFAVGMVVDAAIVVLENIYRLREQGKPIREAALEGAEQVWGAILVSVLTTVMVFLPILVMELEVGQLFRDIAVAISVSVILSLIVAITVIPALCDFLFKGQKGKPSQSKRVSLPLIDNFGSQFVRLVLALTRRVTASRVRALAVVVLVCGSAAAATWGFLPKLEYLPDGNRNLVFGVIQPPPGYNLDTTIAVAEKIENAVRPYWASETGMEDAADGTVKMKHFFFVATRGQTFVGSAAVDPRRAAELVPVMRRPIFSEPGTFGFISQRSLFGRNVGGSRSINLDIYGADLNSLLEVARRATGKVGRILPRNEGNQLRPRPGLELGAPEVRVIPDPVRLNDNGVTARELGLAVDAFNDGVRVAEVTAEGERMDLVLTGRERRIDATQGVSNIPVVTESGKIVPLSSLATVEITAGPQEIRHEERQRTVTLNIRPAPALALEEAIEMIEADVMQALRNEGLPPGVQMKLRGVADKLTTTWNHMVIDLLLAILIVYLVMAVLFESFIYPLIICLSVPLATAGGVGGLAVLNLFTLQQLDMLTLLGFVILVGIVVNNAILLVHRTLFHLRDEGLAPADAILEATRNRIRPIFMSTLTSIFGMMPLVLFPGAGSELYRGLGSVVVGGLSLSAVLTLLIIPPLLTLVAGTEAKKAAAPTRKPRKRRAKPAAQPAE